MYPQTQSSPSFPISVNSTTTHPDSQARNNSWNFLLSHIVCPNHHQGVDAISNMNMKPTSILQLPPPCPVSIISHLNPWNCLWISLPLSLWSASGLFTMKKQKGMITPKLDHNCSRYYLPTYPHHHTPLPLDQVQTAPVLGSPTWISYIPLQFSFSACSSFPTTLVPYRLLSVPWKFWDISHLRASALSILLVWNTSHSSSHMNAWFLSSKSQLNSNVISKNRPSLSNPSKLRFPAIPS